MSTGEEDADKLAEMARAKLRHKIPELRVALTGTVRAHHRFALKQWLLQLQAVEKRIAEFEVEIDKREEQTLFDLLRTVPSAGPVDLGLALKVRRLELQTDAASKDQLQAVERDFNLLAHLGMSTWGDGLAAKPIT